MENEILGLVLIGVMLFAIFIGFPISFTLIFLGFVFGYIGFGPLVFYLMTFQFSSVMLEQTLAAVPLFIFMGLLMEQAGLMERLFKAVQLMLSRVSGSLYLAVLFVSTIFAARCIEGLKVNRAVATGMVAKSLMLSTSLFPQIGYDKAAEVAKAVFLSGKTVRQYVLEHKLLDAEQLDKLLDPASMTEPKGA